MTQWYPRALAYASVLFFLHASAREALMFLKMKFKIMLGSIIITWGRPFEFCFEFKLFQWSMLLRFALSSWWVCSCYKSVRSTGLDLELYRACELSSRFERYRDSDIHVSVCSARIIHEYVSSYYKLQMLWTFEVQCTVHSNWTGLIRLSVCIILVACTYTCMHSR